MLQGQTSMSGEFAEDDPAWIEACRREEAIRDLLRCYPDRMTRRAVEEVAWQLGLSRTTLYELIGRYRAARTVDVLLERAKSAVKPFLIRAGAAEGQLAQGAG